MTTLQPAAESIRDLRRPPNYWVGFLLTILLPGSGFTYINLIRWHVGSVALIMLLGALGGFLTNEAPPYLATAAMLVYYRDHYAKAAEVGWQVKSVSNRLKWTLIIGHFLTSAIAWLILLTNVVMPDYFKSQQQEQQKQARAADIFASYMYTVVMADGQVKSGDCLTNARAVPVPEDVVSCAVDASDPKAPVLTVITKSGKIITRSGKVIMKSGGVIIGP